MGSDTSDTPDTPENLVDEAVQKFIYRHESDRGFVLGLQPDDGGGDVSVTVQEKISEAETYEPPPTLRAHELLDTGSLLAYAKKFGNAGTSMILVDHQAVVLVIDDNPVTGEREIVRCPFLISEDWKLWSIVLGDPMGHRDLCNFLFQQEHNLVDPNILTPLATMKMKTELVLDNDVQGTAENIAVTMRTGDREEMKKFKRRFGITLPVFDQDILEHTTGLHQADCEIRMSLVLPKSTDNPHPTFTLTCPTWQHELVKRVGLETDAIKEKLGVNWTVLAGTHKTQPRVFGPGPQRS